MAFELTFKEKKLMCKFCNGPRLPKIDLKIPGFTILQLTLLGNIRYQTRLITMRSKPDYVEFVLL